MRNLTLDEAQAQDWDVLIIGAGMGGGILGRRLTERGMSVLFIERGPTGEPAEQQSSSSAIADPAARQLRSLWPRPAEFRRDGVATRFFGPYGSGVGGSSAFYAAALERPERHDLDEDTNRPHPTGGWPVGYDAFQPYFDAASELLHLCGTPDPLSREAEVTLHAPTAMSESDTALMEEMRARGLNPYRLHLGVRYPDRCRQCFGHKCPWGCKMDGRSAGVVPALETGRAGLLTNCQVTKIEQDTTRVTGVQVRYDGVDARLQAGTYALCAGSFGSAQILLASDCANSSDWVGRGLMFHIDELFVLWPRKARKEGAGDFRKAISLRDIYSANNQRFGLIQSVGFDVTYENIIMYFNRLYDQSFLRRLPRLRAFLRIPALIANKFLGRGAVFVGMMEDYAYPDNRVVLNPEHPDILTFEYSFHKELLKRRKAFRKALLRTFRGHKRFMVSLQPVLNFGHPVGTLRFGTDKATSVLRPDCRTHDLDNLYVADGSFMPSAMGVNPSLTIAANALRVGDIIVDATRAAAKTDKDENNA